MPSERFTSRFYRGGALALTTAVVSMSLTAIETRPASAADTSIRVAVTTRPIVDRSGHVWSAGGSFKGGRVISVSRRTNIRGTADDNLYRPEMSGMSAWSRPLAKGTYEVTLKMRDATSRRARSRVFSVAAEGRTVLRNIDIVRAVGRTTAYDRSFRTVVTDGRLELRFAARVGKSTVSAIQITPVKQAATPPSTAAGSPAPTTTPASFGARSVGSARYAVPAGAVVVSPSGNDAQAGTTTRPVRTVARALQLTPEGGTIVLRRGVYREFVLVPPGKRVTIQPYPAEAVWFDGSRPVTGWRADGGVWRVDGWTTHFDHSPTYERGAADGQEEFWQFLNPSRPMAAHPDQMWLNGRELTQVSSRAAVTAGTFYVDEAHSALYVGSNPAGSTVEASVLPQAFSLRAPGTVLRGFGVRRYASAVPDQGVINSYFPNMTLDNMTVTDSATGAVGFFESGCTIKNSTVSGAGQLGIQANHADNLTIDNVAVTRSNDQGFNIAPAAGGIKVTSSRNVTLRNSLISDTTGHGFWADESVYNITAAGNRLTNNSGSSIVYELSSQGVIANNTIENSGDHGITIRNTNGIDIWNNTISSTMRTIDISQDWRRASDPYTAGHDTRQDAPDPLMTWVIGDITVRNNILRSSNASVVNFAVEAYDKNIDAQDLRISTDNNVYVQRSAADAPRWLVAWTRYGTDPWVYDTTEQFAQAWNQDAHSAMVTNMTATSGWIGTATAAPLPKKIANAIGRPIGTAALGSWVPRTTS